MSTNNKKNQEVYAKKGSEVQVFKELYFRNYLITSLRIYLTMKLRQIRKMFNY